MPICYGEDSSKVNIEMDKNPENLIELTRYRTLYANADPLLVYSGSRLAATFKTLPVFFDSQPTKNAHPIMFAVIQPKSYPEITRFIDKLNDSMHSYHTTEPDILVYQYYYYANHVEVAPALVLSGSANMALWGTSSPVVTVNINNLNSQSIVRLEIDGQALALGTNLWQPDKMESNCKSYSPNIISKLEAPLKVRWQFAEANPKWHEAMVTVPKLKALKSKADWKEREINLYLYFQKDGKVAAQLLQVVVFKDDKLGIRTTKVSPELVETGPCGTADDRWSEEAVRINN